MSHLRVFFSYVAILTLLCDISNALRTKTSSSYSEDRIDQYSNRNADADTEEDDEYKARNYVSEHEHPRDVPVKVRIQGDLATPPPDAGINLGFVPKQTYYQVRRYDTKVHLPRSAAVEEADTPEELLNAPRLREVVSHKKTQQVYEEQGYEDAAYDHGGYKKGAQRYENKHLAPPAEEDDAATGPIAEAENTSGSNQRARIDHHPESKHIVDSSRTENATIDGGRGSNSNEEDTNDSAESSPKRKSRDETTKRYTSGENDDNEDVSDAPRYKPKSRGVSGLRQKGKKVDDAEPTKAQSAKPSGSVSYVKRRRKINNRYPANSTLGNTKNSLDVDTKTAQESKSVRSKLKSTNRQNRPESRYVKAKNTDKPEELLESDFVSPTTYRPSAIPDTLSLRLQTIANANAKRKPSPLAAGLPSHRIVHQQEARTTSAPAPVPSSFSKNILVDNSGYVFENPFAHFQTTYPPLKWKGPAVAAAAPVAYAVNERPLEFHHQTPLLPPRPYSNATALASKSKFSRSNSKRFPYDIVKANSEEVVVTPTPTIFAPSPDHNVAITSAKWRKKATSLANGRFKKNNFPYEIVTASASSGQDIGTKWPEKYYRFSRKRPKQSRFKNASSPFGTADDSPWIPITPKEAYDIHGYNARRKNSAGVETAAAVQIPVTESLTTENLPIVKRKMSPIRVLENDLIESRLHAPTVSTSYSIRHEYEPGWLDKPVHRFEGWWTTTVPPQINESFDSQRKLFEDTMKAQSQSPSPSTTTNTASSREWTDDSKDIETLSSNRYTVYQPLEYTTSLSTTPLSGVLDEKLLQYRHPYLPRETTHLEPISAPQSQNSTSRIFNDTAPVFNTTKLSISTSNRNFTHLKNSTDNDHRKPDKIIVYPASVGGSDYASTASFVQNLTLAHFADPNNSVHSSLPLNYRDRFNTLKDHLAKNKTNSRKIRSASTNQQLLNVYMDGSTTEITVDLRKYPFYKSVSEARSVGGNPLAKYSVLRYISNPNMVPTKTAGQMSFYQSTNRIRCPEPDAPVDVPIPERERDGDWIGDEKVKGRGEPRVKNVGRSIMCHKIKFFGSDPLDNPFFKEESIGFPLIFPSSVSSSKKKSKTKRAAIIATRGGANDDANSSGNKKTRKVHLAGGFINQRDYSSNKDANFGSSTIKTTTLANEVNLTTSGSDASVVATTMMTTTTSMVKNAHTTPIVFNASEGENRINLANPTYKLSSDYRAPIDKSKKKVYVDSDTNASERVPVKPQYKEPSWRNKKRQQAAATVTTVSTPAEVVGGHVTPNSRVDSLLYVIHPHSGRGKWMKILKVEQLPDDKNSASENVEIRPQKHESVVPNNAKEEDQFVQKNYRNSCDSNVGLGFGFGFGQSNEMTQQTWPRDGIKRANVPVPVQVPQAADQTYQISGLLRQVAPLKASQVEINNLQTTAADDHLEVDVDSDGDEIVIPPSLSQSSSIQPRYKHRDHIQFPQPHERLYYYVVDE